MLGWGWLSWGNAGHTLGPTTLGSLVEIGIAQIACAEKCFLVLTKTGKVYVCQYTSEGQVRDTMMYFVVWIKFLQVFSFVRFISDP